LQFHCKHHIHSGRKNEVCGLEEIVRRDRSLFSVSAARRPSLPHVRKSNCCRRPPAHCAAVPDSSRARPDQDLPLPPRLFFGGRRQRGQGRTRVHRRHTSPCEIFRSPLIKWRNHRTAITITPASSAASQEFVRHFCTRRAVFSKTREASCSECAVNQWCRRFGAVSFGQRKAARGVSCQTPGSAARIWGPSIRMSSPVLHKRNSVPSSNHSSLLREDDVSRTVVMIASQARASGQRLRSHLHSNDEKYWHVFVSCSRCVNARGFARDAGHRALLRKDVGSHRPTVGFLNAAHKFIHKCCVLE